MHLTVQRLNKKHIRCSEHEHRMLRLYAWVGAVSDVSALQRRAKYRKLVLQTHARALLCTIEYPELYLALGFPVR